MRRLLALFAAALTFTCCATTFQWDPSPTPGVSLYELQWSEEGSAVWQAATTSEHEHSVSLPDGTYRARVRALPDGLPCLLDAEPCSASVWEPAAPHLGFVVGEASSAVPVNNYDPGSLTFQYTVEEPPTMALSTTPDFWWKLDETSGSVAVNSGDYGTPSDYNGTVFAYNSGSTAWLGSSETWGSGGIQGGIELSPVGSTGAHATGVNINTNPPLDGLTKLTLTCWSENDGTGAGDARLFFNGRTWLEAGHLVMLGYSGFEDIRTRINGATQLDAAGNEYTTSKVHWAIVIDYSLGSEQLKLYKNGVKVFTVDDLPGTEIDESLATDGSGGFVSIIGAAAGSNASLRSNSFGGKIADMRIWMGEAATAGEVEDIYDNSLGAATPTAESETTTLAAVLQKQNNARTASLSANLQKAFTGTASTSAVLAQIIEKQTATAATLQAEQADTTTLNAALKQALSLGASLNVLQQLVQSGSVSTSAALRYDATTTLTLDSAILANRSLISALNSALQVALTNTATLNSVAIQETAKSLSLSTSMQQLQSVGLPLSAAVAQRNEAVAALASVLERAGAVATAVTALAQSLGSVTTALSFSPQNLASVGLSANAVLVAAGEVVNTLTVTALLQTSDDVQAAASSMIQELHEETLALTVPIQVHSSVSVGTNAIILGQVTDAVTATMVSVLQAAQAQTLGLSAAIAQQDAVSAAVAGVLATQEQATTAVNTLAESSETSTATLLSLTLKQWVTTTVLTAAIQLAPTLGTTVNAVLAASSTQRTLTAVALLQHPGLSIASGVSAVLVLSDSVPVLVVTEPTITASVSGDAVTLISVERDIQTPLPLPTAITIVSESTDVEIV